MFQSDSEKSDDDKEFDITLHENYSIAEQVHQKQCKPKAKTSCRQSDSMICTKTNGEDSEETSSSLHKWVFDLKAIDTSKVYSNQSLIIIRGKCIHLSSKSWKQITNISLTLLRSHLDEIIIIPRSSYGQMYIVQGLQKSLHFSLGPIGKNEMIAHFDKSDIKTTIIRGTRKESPAKDITTGIYVKTAEQINNSNYERSYKDLMSKMAFHLWPTLFGVRIK